MNKEIKVEKTILKASALALRFQPLTARLNNHENLAECRKLFDELKSLPDYPVVNQLIFQCYADLVRGFGNAGMIDEAEQAYNESLAFPRREDMIWEQNWVTVKMIIALSEAGREEEAAELTEKMKQTATDSAQDQAWLAYYIKESKTTLEPIPHTPNEDTTDTDAATEPDETKPYIATWEADGRDFWCGNYEKQEGYAFLRRPFGGHNFWQQPGRFTEETRPRTEAEIAHFESRMGYRLPELLRQQLKQQNGGTVRYDTYVSGTYSDPVLYDVTFQGIPAIGAAYETLSDTYGSYMEPEDWDEALGTGANPDRLYVLSYLHGHSILCLDYGTHEPQPRTEPQVVLYYTESGFEEQLRVDTYSEFVSRLVYNETTYHVGIKTSRTLDQLKDLLTEKLLLDTSRMNADQIAVLKTAHIDTAFQRKEYDPAYCWDYDYHYVALTLCDRKKYLLRLMPNRYRGGNHVFQDNTEYNFILEIEPTDTGYDRVMAGPAWIERLIEKFAATDVEADILLPE